jgi:hypothetical protein
MMDDEGSPSVPIAELRGHKDGPIHVVRFTSERLMHMSYNATSHKMISKICPVSSSHR